jgi:hypothetical protein
MTCLRDGRRKRIVKISNGALKVILIGINTQNEVSQELQFMTSATITQQ